MATDFSFRRGALEELAGSMATADMLSDVADSIKDTARVNAQSIDTRLAKAIDTSGPQRDAEGTYVDVGYNENHPGFVLWWHEVGTVDFPAKPHLRPAVTQRGHLT